MWAALCTFFMSYDNCQKQNKQKRKEEKTKLKMERTKIKERSFQMRLKVCARKRKKVDVHE